MLSLITKFRLKGQLKSPDIGTQSKAVDFLAKHVADPSAVKLLVMARNKEGGNGVGYMALKAIESVNSAGAVNSLLSNPQQSPVIEEFQKCPEWQLAAAILARAIGQDQRRGTEAVIAVPAKWLPPQL